jgi:hypothetical protein
LFASSLRRDHADGRRSRQAVILVWDNLNTHHSKAMRAFADGHPNWLTVIQLPGYAPDLNPVKGAWSSMKSAPTVRPRRPSIPQWLQSDRSPESASKLTMPSGGAWALTAPVRSVPKRSQPGHRQGKGHSCRTDGVCAQRRNVIRKLWSVTSTFFTVLVGK